MDIVELYTREDGTTDWRRLDGDNGQVISTSGGQGYEDRDECERMARRLNGPGVEYRQV